MTGSGKTETMEEKILYKCDLVMDLMKENEVVVYGAGVMGRALMKCLKGAPYRLSVTCFLVGNMEGNPEEIEGIPVLDLVHGMEYKEKTVLVALHEKNMAGAMEELRDRGFRFLVPVSFDSDVWSNICGNWLYCNQAECDLSSYLDLDEALKETVLPSEVFREALSSDQALSADQGILSDQMPTDTPPMEEIHIYVVHSAVDKVLREEVPLRSFEIPIQVGAALTDRELFPVRDSQGENISAKNPQYCELTALYWIWKHDNAKYTGLSHYRRKFELTGEQAQKLLHSDIDVVVTVPVLNFVGIRQQYCCDHEVRDWDVMLEAVREIHPKYADAADRVQKGLCYYGYNMFIARKEILDDYCRWLFPILSYCEEKTGTKVDCYQNRYIGFLGERLLTVYLEQNKQYKLAIARKHFIESA